VTLTVNTAAGTPGYVQASSPQSNVAPASVSVTYGSGQTTAFIDIQSPAPNTTVASPFTVSGVGAGLFFTPITVQAFSSANLLLAQQTATLQGSEVGNGGQGTWSVSLSVNVPSGTPGYVRAFSSQYQVQDQVNVVYGTGSPGSIVFPPGQCSIQARPNAPYHSSVGGPISGYFSPAGGTFPAIAGAVHLDQNWYQFDPDPNTSNPLQWAPSTSLAGTIGVCTW
jgi:hypothetical protein